MIPEGALAYFGRHPGNELLMHLTKHYANQTSRLLETQPKNMAMHWTEPLILFIGCQSDDPLASLVTTNRIINVYGFLVVVMLPIYSVLIVLYFVGVKITATTTAEMNFALYKYDNLQNMAILWIETIKTSTLVIWMTSIWQAPRYGNKCIPLDCQPCRDDTSEYTNGCVINAYHIRYQSATCGCRFRYWKIVPAEQTLTNPNWWHECNITSTHHAISLFTPVFILTVV